MKQLTVKSEKLFNLKCIHLSLRSVASPPPFQTQTTEMTRYNAPSLPNERPSKLVFLDLCLLGVTLRHSQYFILAGKEPQQHCFFLCHHGNKSSWTKQEASTWWLFSIPVSILREMSGSRHREAILHGFFPCTPRLLMLPNRVGRSSTAANSMFPE